MKDEIRIKEVQDRCVALRRAQLWPSENEMKPRAWLENFDQEDKITAVSLLEKFTFCNKETVDALLHAAWHSIGDGLKKGPETLSSFELISALSSAVFTPIEGEDPNRADSGNFMCRRARQLLRIEDDKILSPEKALESAKQGCTVVFIDDFIGSGDQFISTWKRKYPCENSFESVQKEKGFVAMYLTLITTDKGLDRINYIAPTVAVCPAHVITKKSTINGLIEDGIFDNEVITNFLSKYANRLTPNEKVYGLIIPIIKCMVITNEGYYLVLSIRYLMQRYLFSGLLVSITGVP